MFESVLLLGPLGLEHGLLHAWSIPELLKVFVHHHLDLVHVLLRILLHLQLPSLLTLVDLRHHLLLLLVLKVFLGVFLHFRNIRKRHRDNINKEVVDIVNDKVADHHYKESEDLSQFTSSVTGQYLSFLTIDGS